MPSRNITKVDAGDSYYHVYARGASKQDIFLDTQDYNHFIGFFARYLSLEPHSSKAGVAYPNYSEGIELLCYCLMPNHFHLLFYQKEPGTMTKLMQSIMTSYSRYFNLKYKRSGALFESRYKANRIDAQNYLEHISRYIHLNPRYWRRYPYSSISCYTNNQDAPEYIQTKRVLDMFGSRTEYMDFVADYEEYKLVLDEVKRELADN